MTYDPVQAWTVAPSRVWAKATLVDFDKGPSLPSGSNTCEVRIISTDWLAVRTRSSAGDVTKVAIYPQHRITEVVLSQP